LARLSHWPTDFAVSSGPTGPVYSSKRVRTISVKAAKISGSIGDVVKFRLHEIETESQYCDGRTVVDRWLVTDRPKNCNAGIDVDAKRFLELLVERISSLP